MTTQPQQPVSFLLPAGAVDDSGTAAARSRTVTRRAGAAGAMTGLLPPAAWSRLLVLFIALAAIKIALLAGLGRHLCEIHWRIGGPPVVGHSYPALLVFVCFGVLSLLGLARQCREVGVKAVRSANAAVLGLGLCFIFLTFHSGDNNYLYPIETGVLKWTSLGPYLSLDLFFRPPFLAAWLLGYAFAYCFLARTGREAWVLHLTAIVAGAYGLACLGELADSGNELLILDCVGVVSLLALARSATPAGKEEGAAGVWVLLPMAWCLGFAAALCGLASGHEREPLRYLLMLLTAALALFAAATALARKHGYLRPWSAVLCFCFTGFLLLTNTHYPMGANYNNALCLGMEFPHYFVGELLVVAALGLCATVYSKLRPEGRFWWLDVLSLLFIAVAFIDLRLSRIMGVRLDWDLIAFSMSPKVMWRMSKPYLPAAFGALAILAVVYALAVRTAQTFGRRSGTRAPGWGPLYALGCFVLLGVLGSLLANPDKAEGQAGLRLAQTSPIWTQVANRPMTREELLSSARALGLGDFDARVPAYSASERRNLNVVLIFLESSFNQHLSLFGSAEQTQPLLSAYKDRMELFPNFFSDFAGSAQARFATFTGLYPVRDFNEFTLRRVSVKSLFEVFHENGYACSLFHSGLLDYAGLREFLSHRGLDEMYDANNMPGPRRTEPVSWGLREEETLPAIQNQIRKYAAGGQRFFLTYMPAAPHYPYDAVAERFRKFKGGQLGDYTPQYQNELLSIDWMMASILDELKETGLLDRTLVIITNDHGEKTGAGDGTIGHGWYLTPQLANTPLIILDPQNSGCRINYAFGSQIDVLPTVLDLLKIPLPPGQLYEGRSLYARPADERVIYLNTYEQYGVVNRGRFVCGSRKADEGAAACSRTVYAISNEGSKTLFTEAHEPGQEHWLIRPFDEFQANFLRNYSFYCKAVRRAEPAQVVADTSRH